LVIQANKGIASAENYQVYLIDGNKLIPLVEQEKPAPGTYKGVVTTEKALQDIRLLVKAGLSVEIVSIMP
jgi:hypothetical protein